LCRSAVGAKSGWLVRNTAVPGTMCGSFFSRLGSNVSSGTSVRRVFCIRILVPRRQVRISRTIEAPNSSGAQAPSNSLSRLADRNVTSTTTSGATTSITRQSGQRHSFQITMKANRPSTTMVVVTAMP
jgi:hypothetical protein